MMIVGIEGTGINSESQMLKNYFPRTAPGSEDSLMPVNKERQRDTFYIYYTFYIILEA